MNTRNNLMDWNKFEKDLRVSNMRKRNIGVYNIVVKRSKD